MAVEIEPNIYMSGMQWSCRPSNKIDTVQMQPISNTVPNEGVGIANQKITSGIIDGYTEVVNFADISDNQPATYRHSSWNTYSALLGDVEAAKGLVTCVMASGNIVITTDKAIQGIPQATLNFKGNTLTIGRREKTYDYFPSLDDIKNSNFNLFSWIVNKVGTDNIKTGQLSWRYDKNTCSFNPWIYKFVPSDTSATETFTTDEDVATKWYTSENGNQPLTGQWSGTQNVSTADEARGLMQPAESVQPTHMLKIRNLNVPISVTVEKYDDYTFSIWWRAPIRFAYVAASQCKQVIGGYFDIDSYAFADAITEIEISLVGKPLSDTPVDVAYSLDTNSQLTTVLKNDHPLKISKVECFTIGTGYTEIKTSTKTYTKENVTFTKGFYDDQGTIHPDGDYTCTENAITIDANITKSISLRNIAHQYVTNVLLMNGSTPVQQYTPDKNATYITIDNIPNGVTGINISINKQDLDSFSLIVVTGRYEGQWSDTIALKLLTKYKNGKYVVTVEVNARWAIQNDVHVGTQAYVYLQNSQPITRDNVKCIFEVKNIEKRFEGSKFTYELKLLEV